MPASISSRRKLMISSGVTWAISSCGIGSSLILCARGGSSVARALLKSVARALLKQDTAQIALAGIGQHGYDCLALHFGLVANPDGRGHGRARRYSAQNTFFAGQP